MPWRAADGGRDLCSSARRFSAASSASTSAMQKVRGAGELHGEAGVEHVGRGHALVHEARFRADDSRRRCVRKAMTSCLTSRSISSMRAMSKPAALAQDLRRPGRHLAELLHRFGGMRLDLEPDLHTWIDPDQMAAICGRE